MARASFKFPTEIDEGSCNSFVSGGSIPKVKQQVTVLAGTAEGMATKHAVCVATLVLLLTTSVLVEGQAILGPDLNSCKPVLPKPGKAPEDYYDCCFIETGKPIKDFKFNLDLPMRVRRPAHKVDDEFVRKYERAVELMKALPPEDPRSFVAQYNLHCIYCARAYSQLNSSVDLGAHNGWFFFPFHRWYLYFHERILASLIGDDTFAVPYWAWDVQGESNPPANSIPFIYTDPNSSLYDENRSKARQGPKRVELDYVWGREEPAAYEDPNALVQDNFYNMWRTQIGNAKTTEAFMGGMVFWGEDDYRRAGTCEDGPHTSVHKWVGDETKRFAVDLMPSFAAARDPMFFAHHSQVDRLWLLWKNWGGKDHDHPDWLASEFLFYDENADLVRVNVRDSLSLDNLRVTYDLIEPDWRNYTPRSMRDIDPKYRQAGILTPIWRQVLAGETYRTIARALRGYFQTQKNGAKVSLGGVRRAAGTWRVSRPEVLRSSDDSSVHDEVLVIAGVVEKPFDVDVVVDIFLELPEADENTPHRCVEFLDILRVETEEGLRPGMNPTVTLEFRKTIGIRERLKILDIIRQRSVTVTFVPAWDPQYDSEVAVRVTELKVEMKLAR